MQLRIEKEIEISVKDKPRSKIHGVLSYHGGKKPSKVVAFVHGLACGMSEAKYYLGAREFEKAGFAALRVSLYSWKPHAKKLRGSSVKTQAADVREIVAWLRSQGFQKIFLVGHSYGGPAILCSQVRDISGVVLWEPTSEHWLKASPKELRARYVKGLKSYIMDWGVAYVLNEKFFKDAQAVPPYAELIKRSNYPVLIIMASRGILAKDWLGIEKQFLGQVEKITIKGAGHDFDEKDSLHEVLSKSVRWCKRRARVS